MQIPVADAHCDFLFNMWNSRHDIKTLSDNQVTYLPYLRQGGVALQFFAVWIDRTLRIPYLQQCLAMIDAYSRMLEENEAFTPLTNEFTPESGKIATVLTVEGGEAIEGSLAVLRVLKRLGVSAMTLTWNHNNELAGAAIKKNGKGLSTLGREVLKEMERIGIALDLSHLNDASIDDVLSNASRPVFASHSNARSVFFSDRALSDTHIRAVSEMSGVVGVNFFYKQLSSKDTAQISDIVKHIVHIAEIGGVDCCAIGSDFDGMTKYPYDIPNSSYFPALLQALLHEGFSEQDIRKIAYQNLYNYIIQFV